MECTNLSYNLVGIGQEYPVNEEIDRSSYAFKKIESTAKDERTCFSLCKHNE